MKSFARKADRLLVILSDIEMGSGGPEDDFPHSDFLADLLQTYNGEGYRDIAIDLIFNGDTFDLLKTDYQGKYPRHVSADVALDKMARVANAHRPFFEGVRRFLDHTAAPRRAIFVVGNHDMELFFPAVQRLIQDRINDPDGGPETNPKPVADGKLLFAGIDFSIGRVHIEHGSQADALFRVDATNPFLDHNGQRLLNISWGAAALMDTVIPFKPLLYFHDRLIPKNDAFNLIPEIKELLMGRIWKYWTRDYWKDWLAGGDPTRKLTWTMVSEVVSRLRSQDVEIKISAAFQNRMRSDDRFLLYVIGHEHESGWWSYSNRKVLQTSCLRNEYALLNGGGTLQPMPKSFAEVYMRGDSPIISQLIEIEGPPPPRGYLPDSIFAVLPKVRELLGSEAERAAASAAQHRQEKREANDDG